MHRYCILISYYTSWVCNIPVSTTITTCSLYYNVRQDKFLFTFIINNCLLRYRIWRLKSSWSSYINLIFFYRCETCACECVVWSTARYTIHLQFDISAIAFEIRAVESSKCVVWCAVDCTYSYETPTIWMLQNVINLE
jgi:hypothetical protein